MLLTSSAWILALLLPRKFFITRTNAFHASSSISFIEFSNSGSLMSWRIWETSKMSAFNFSMVYPGKAWHKRVKHPCPYPWWTVWLIRAWCAAVGRAFCLFPPEDRWWRSFLCKKKKTFLLHRPVLHFLSRLPHALFFCFAAQIFGRLRGFMTLNLSLFDIITWNSRTWALLVIQIIISNKKNRHGILPPQPSSKPLHTCVHVNKNVKTGMWP